MSETALKIGDIVEGEIKKIYPFGALVQLSGNIVGLIHISQVADDFVKDINDHLKIGERISAKVKKIAADGKIDLTLKKNKRRLETVEVAPKREFKNTAFREKIDEFLLRENPHGSARAVEGSAET
ncbi:MAG: S1 RNA-binding domain-containing protein [Candidatus Omnitrophica bacterium]|nr:S1 RNA-binding domain-containing protein [Candidatus Omnitrophota bacterium]